jgi:hypothetical protein
MHRLAALVAAVAIPATCQAQAIWMPHFPQSWPPGAYLPNLPYEQPFSHRYNYYTGPALYFGMNGRQAWEWEYLDRVDRAERFGRPIPPPPPQLLDQSCCKPRIIRRGKPVPVQPGEVIEVRPVPNEEGDGVSSKRHRLSPRN